MRERFRSHIPHVVRWLPVAILLIFPFITHILSLLGYLSSDPIAVYSGLADKLGPSPLPGLAYADPNVGFTSEALGHLAARDWLHGTVPWWNPYEGVGTPLAGEMQSAALFPFVLLLGVNNGQLFFHISLQIVAGLSAYALFRRMSFPAWVSLVGGVLFEVNGTFSWFGHAPYNPVAFLPMILYGVEKAYSTDGSLFRSWQWIAVGLAASIYAGFPETAYIDGLFVFGWAVIRATLLRGNHLGKYIGRIIIGGTVGIALSMPLIIAFADYLTYGFVGGHEAAFAYVHSDKLAIPMLFIPYIYGTITSLSGSDPSGTISNIWVSVGGYVGLSVVVSALLGFMLPKHRPLKIYLSIWTIVALAKTFGYPPVTRVWNLIPLISNTAFFRYAAPSWEFAFITLSLFALSGLSSRGRKFTSLSFVGILVLISSLVLPSVPMIKQLLSVKKYAEGLLLLEAWSLLIVFTIAFAIVMRNRERAAVILGIIMTVEMVANFTVPILANPTYFSLAKGGVTFLQQNLGLQRFYSLGPIAPNYGSYYRVSSINYNDLPVPSIWAEYVTTKLNQNSDPILFTGYTLANPLGPSPVDELRRNMLNYEWLGVKYIVVPSAMPNPFIPTTSYGATGAQNIAYVLGANNLLSGRLSVSRSGDIDTFSVLIGNYSNTATGQLRVKLSVAGQSSSSGEADLKQSKDNSLLEIHLNHPVSVTRGQELSFTIQHATGHPVAIWLWPSTPSSDEHLIYNDSRITGKSAMIVLSFIPARGISAQQVYHDSAMSIYQLPKYAKFYSSNSNSVSLTNSTLDGVTADSKANATLVRRELFFPGWTAYVNGHQVPLRPYEGIFQSISIPKGHSSVTFTYVPPGARISGLVMAIGFILLLFPFYKIGRTKKKKESSIS